MRETREGWPVASKSLRGCQRESPSPKQESREGIQELRYGLIQTLLAALLLVKSRSGVVRRTPAVAWVHPETVGSTVMVTLLLVPGDIWPSLQLTRIPWVHPLVAETKVVNFGNARSAKTFRASSSWMLVTVTV